MALRFTTAEARVLFDRVNKTRGLPQDQRAAYKELQTVCRKHSALEVMFAHQIRVLSLPAPVRNLRFAPPRKWELDFAWPKIDLQYPGIGSRVMTSLPGLAFEIQGGVHQIKSRFEADTEKFFNAILLGWTIVAVSRYDVRSGRAAAWLTTLLEARQCSGS